MATLISWILAFIAGIVVGSLTTALLPRLRGKKKRRAELVNARERILVGIKQQHERDIRREIFQTAEAIRGELNRSLRRLLSLTERVLGQVHDDSNGNKEDKEPGARETGESDRSGKQLP
ncbi:MAG: hypothetical protein ACREQ7_09045 [Candidatus Binatia bacterium]